MLFRVVNFKSVEKNACLVYWPELNVVLIFKILFFQSE